MPTLEAQTIGLHPGPGLPSPGCGRSHHRRQSMRRPRIPEADMDQEPGFTASGGDHFADRWSIGGSGTPALPVATWAVNGALVELGTHPIPAEIITLNTRADGSDTRGGICAATERRGASAVGPRAEAAVPRALSRIAVPGHGLAREGPDAAGRGVRAQPDRPDSGPDPGAGLSRRRRPAPRGNLAVAAPDPPTTSGGSAKPRRGRGAPPSGRRAGSRRR